ncbi:REC8 meiotic recombination protein b isoform X2 [Cynoglossus semilaevis]|nr:meiotic recombination protein REC8 homolog isoform X2 [Cynoglossus semilaevis]
MAESDRLILNGHDNLNSIESAEGAQDPFFGFINTHQNLSPFEIYESTLMYEEDGSQHPLVPSPETTPQDLTLSPDSITLMEEQFILSNAECFEGDDLPEVTAREIDLLMHQPDQFYIEMEEQQTRDGTRDLIGEMSFIDQLNRIVAEAEQDDVEERVFWKGDHPEK